MLKTISAALLATSIIAAPVLAANSDKSTQGPAMNKAQVNQNAAGANAKAQTKTGALDANAKVSKPRAKTVKHHRSHHQAGTLRTSGLSKVSTKHVAPKTKRS